MQPKKQNAQTGGEEIASKYYKRGKQVVKWAKTRQKTLF